MGIKYCLTKIEDELEDAQDISALKSALLKLTTFIEIHDVSIDDTQECLQLLVEGKKNAAKRYFEKYIFLDEVDEVQDDDGISRDNRVNAE